MKPTQAAAYNNLGLVQCQANRLREAEHSMRKAVEAYRVLNLGHSNRYDFELGGSLNNLGNILIDLRRSEDAEEAAREAVSIARRFLSDHPLCRTLLGTCLNTLGVVLLRQWRLEEAATALEEAVEIRRTLAASSTQSFGSDLVSTLMNLGALADDAGRPSDAIPYYTEALAIARGLAERQPEAHLPRLAGVLCNTGNAQRDLGQLAEAEANARESLAIYAELAADHPLTYQRDLAEGWLNLGTILLEQGRLAASEQAYREATAQLDMGDFPVVHQKVLSNLGNCLIRQGRYREGRPLLQDAVARAEALRAETLSLGSRARVLRENVRTYDRLVHCLVQLGGEEEIRQALAVAEHGKSRSLADLMSLRRMRPSYVSAEVSRRYEYLLALPPADVLTTDEILELAEALGSILVLFRVTEFGTYVFLVLPTGDFQIVKAPALTSEVLRQKLYEWLRRYGRFRSALTQFGQAEAGLGIISEARKRWCECLDQVLSDLHYELIGSVRSAILNRTARSPSEDERQTSIVFIPTRDLTILPLHACSWERNGSRRYLIDDFTISYAPSIAILKQCWLRKNGQLDLQKKATFVGVAVTDAQGQLRLAEWECKEAARLLDCSKSIMLFGTQATKGRVLEEAEAATFLHISSHGTFDLRSSLDSFLDLGPGERVMASDALRDLRLDSAALVMLSACETGLLDHKELADEHYGLSTAFLLAGTPTVCSSLWMVSEASTALLSSYIYAVVKGNGLDVARSLRDAQIWIREATTSEILASLDALRTKTEPGSRDYAELFAVSEDLKKHYSSAEKPFQHPYWWGAFSCMGA